MNICIFSGRLGKDATTRQTNNGTSVTSFSIGVDTGYGDHKRTEWVNCVLWKREGIVPHLTKGKAVIVSGELQTRKWQDQSGQDKYITEIVVREIEFQQGTPKGQGQQSQGQYQQHQVGDDPFGGMGELPDQPF